jgi:predicted RNase H-like HicB family nuclease
MQRQQRLTAIIEREDEGFVALCPELDIASQGSSIEDARANLVEALTLFFENASSSEVNRRFRNDEQHEFVAVRQRALFRSGFCS